MRGAAAKSGLTTSASSGLPARRLTYDLEPLAFPDEELRHVAWEWECDHHDEVAVEMPTMQESRQQIRTPFEEDKLAEFWAASALDEVHTGSLAFVESIWFQSVVGFVIALNAVFIGIETDIKSPYWYPLEQAMLVFFVAELILRMCHHGSRFLTSWGNIFDVFIVTSGAFDTWYLPLADFITGVEEERTQNTFMHTFQMLRLLRIIRLIRLVKIVQPLYRLALGIAEAIQGMFWVLVFLGMMLYAMAIVLTRILNHPLTEHQVDADDLTQISGKDEVCSGGCSLAALDVPPAKVRAMFSSVTASMFILFESMSCWSLMRFSPLFERMPLLKLSAVLFYIFAAWALLAVMTGVVSEKMISAREKMKTDGQDREQEKSSMAIQVLEHLFRKADTDDSGAISREEFDTMLMCTDVTKQLMEHSAVNAEDLNELFEWLDHDKDGSVSIKEFLEGFRWLNDNISPKTFLKLQEEVATDLKTLEKRCTDFINQRFDVLIAAVSQPLRKIHAVTEQIQRLDIQLCHGNLDGETLEGLCDDFRRMGPPTRAALEALETRLDARLDKVLLLVEELADMQSKGLVRLVNRE